ncbi:MAG: hypothetical protein ACRD4H_05710 [Candidatus Acidiferrales bacterium]
MIKQNVSRRWLALAFVLSWVCFAPASARPQQDMLKPDEPETILGTFHVIKGHEAEMATLLAQAWQTYRKLDYVFSQPHVILQGTENGGQPYFVEVFTWKSSEYPDHAPAEVLAVWKKMNAICERRDNKPGIERSEDMRLIFPAQPQ